MGKVHYVEAPNRIPSDLDIGKDRPVAVFLAGGITGCPDHQKETLENLRMLCGWDSTSPDLLILNPRRANFPIHDPNAAREQIEWEYRMLRRADIISFWFCKAQIQPIVLFEYGYWLGQDKPKVVGIEPGYSRTQDVQIQTDLKLTDEGAILMQHESLQDLAAAICKRAAQLKAEEWE